MDADDAFAADSLPLASCDSTSGPIPRPASFPAAHPPAGSTARFGFDRWGCRERLDGRALTGRSGTSAWPPLRRIHIRSTSPPLWSNNDVQGPAWGFPIGLGESPQQSPSVSV